MRILALSGSARRLSTNTALLHALARAAPEGVEVRVYDRIADLPVFSPDLDDAPPPVVQDYIAEIGAADALVISSPEYVRALPGGLKNALDWLSRLPAAPLRQKPILIQSASPGALGGVRMQYHLRQTFVFLDARPMNLPEAMIGGAYGKSDGATGDLTDEATRDFLRKQLAAFADFVRS